MDGNIFTASKKRADLYILCNETLLKRLPYIRLTEINLTTIQS